VTKFVRSLYSDSASRRNEYFDVVGRQLPPVVKLDVIFERERPREAVLGRLEGLDQLVLDFGDARRIGCQGLVELSDDLTGGGIGRHDRICFVEAGTDQVQFGVPVYRRSVVLQVRTAEGTDFRNVDVVVPEELALVVK